MFNPVGNDVRYPRPFLLRQVVPSEQRVEQHVDGCLPLSYDHDVQQIEEDRQSDEQEDYQVKQGRSEQHASRFVDEEDSHVVSNPKVNDVKSNRKEDD